jgi:NADH:ubiquinone oxidoreductase subunit 5 (subunit L)/multisubunit Na+/H+ antiporter MnhA subunit
MFVVTIIFIIINPNVISILLSWDALGLVSYLFVVYYQNVRSYGAEMVNVLCVCVHIYRVSQEERT